MRILTVLISLFLITNISVARELPFGSGSEKGSYFDMMNDIISEDWCAPIDSKDTLVNVASGASLDNIDGIMNKRFYGGIVQADVLKYYGKTLPNQVNKNNIGVITGMHLESFHLLIPKNWKPKGTKKAWYDLSDDTAVAIEMSSLKGQTVGSWGGSLVSLKALSSFADINLNIVEIPESQRSSPNVPVLIVGGQPSSSVTDILETNNFKLVSINYLELATNAPFYVKSDLSYNVGGKLVVVPSVGVQALLIAKKFRRETKNALSVELATCLDESIYDLADDFDTNPNWGSAAELYEAGVSIDWTYFNLSE